MTDLRQERMRYSLQQIEWAAKHGDEKDKRIAALSHELLMMELRYDILLRSMVDRSIYNSPPPIVIREATA